MKHVKLTSLLTASMVLALWVAMGSDAFAVKPGSGGGTTDVVDLRS